MHKASRNNTYLGELFNRYVPLLYGVCLKYLKDSDNAKDAVMQLFENLLDRITDYDIAAFRPWVYSVTKNHCLQILRKKEQMITVDFNDFVMEFDKIMYLLEEDKPDRIQSLEDCLEKLPEEQRLSIQYFFKSGLSYAEIANKTGYTLKHVKSYIQNGKRNLKICIEKTNG
jgi:RNA polymerase sigma-70 factor (ECF subfamily)